MAKTVLRLTNNAATVKLSSAGAYTIGLETDLLLATEEVATPTVNIARIIAAGAAGSTVNIARNAVDIMDIAPEHAVDIDLAGSGINDNIENDSDIVVTITGDAHVYIILRKMTGYATKFEPEQFGSHDDPDVVGS